MAMTDLTERLKAKGGACAEYEVERSYIMEVCLGTQIPLKVADACIAELLEEVRTTWLAVEGWQERSERAEGVLSEECRLRQKAEAEVERLRWMLDEVNPWYGEYSRAEWKADLAARYEKEHHGTA